MNPDKVFKAFLITVGGVCVYIIGSDYPSALTKFLAGCTGAGVTPLLAYLLKPFASPEMPSGTPQDPVSTKEVEGGAEK